MTTRGEMARAIGGRWLVKAILRQHPNRYRQKWQTRRAVEQMRLADLDQKHLNEPVPDVLSKPVHELTDQEKAFLRDRFYEDVNMTAPALRRWLYDPRVLDGVSRARPFYYRWARAHLRSLIWVRSTSRQDGMGWNDQEYIVARKSIFVIDNLYQARWIDYEAWAVLQNFGRNWEKPTRVDPGRRLPAKVRLEAQLALLRLEIAGEPRNTPLF